MTNPPKRSSLLSIGPVIVALVVVTGLIVTMIVLDTRLADQTATETFAAVRQSQRSMMLLDRIRSKGIALHRAGLTEDERAELVRDIEADKQLLDPLVVDPLKRAEWLVLQAQLGSLATAKLEDLDRRRTLARLMDESADRMLEISEEEAHAVARHIRALHRASTRDHLALGGIAIAIVAAIAIVLIRSLRRQRVLIDAHVAMLAERNRDLEAFAGRAAHDLRSPMNPIRGYADLLLEAQSTDDAAMMAKKIRMAVDRMARVVDDMLALSVAGRPPPGECESDEVVRATLAELASELADVTVKTELAGGRIACPASILQQLLRNLVENALKYRDRARPLAIRIATRAVGGDVELAIEDNGVGMDAEIASHAFEPLYRGRSDREVPGHGLGLAIVSRTVRALGGSCELTSEVDRGTRVVVTVPRGAA